MLFHLCVCDVVSTPPHTQKERERERSKFFLFRFGFLTFFSFFCCFITHNSMDHIYDGKYLHTNISLFSRWPNGYNGFILLDKKKSNSTNNKSIVTENSNWIGRKNSYWTGKIFFFWIIISCAHKHKQTTISIDFDFCCFVFMFCQNNQTICRSVILDVEKKKLFFLFLWLTDI